MIQKSWSCRRKYVQCAIPVLRSMEALEMEAFAGVLSSAHPVKLQPTEALLMRVRATIGRLWQQTRLANAGTRPVVHVRPQRNQSWPDVALVSYSMKRKSTSDAEEPHKPVARTKIVPNPPGIDYRSHPELYKVARGEQGVLTVEPYKSEILPHWRFRCQLLN